MTLPLWLKKFCIQTGVTRFMPSARRAMKGETRYLRYYSDRVLAAPVESLLDSAAFPSTIASDVVNLNLSAPEPDADGQPRKRLERLSSPSAWGSAELREVIAGRYGQRDISPYENIFVTHGASAAYAAALDAFVNPGDSVVLWDPCSPLFSVGAESRRAKVCWVPTWNEEGHCRFLEESLRRAMLGAKMVVITNPSNPTGGILNSDEWELIGWHAKRNDTLIFVDESFTRYSYDQETIIPQLPELTPRLIRSGSISQEFGMRPHRVGWVCAHRQLTKAIALVANLNAPYVPMACQSMALEALTKPEDLFKPTLERFRERRQYCVDRLKAMNLETVWPGGAYFLWIPVSQLGMTGREFTGKLLKEERVLVGSGDVFGPSGMGMIRLSYAQEDGRLREGLTRLGDFIGRLGGSEKKEAVPEPIAPLQIEPPAYSRT